MPLGRGRLEPASGSSPSRSPRSPSCGSRSRSSSSAGRPPRGTTCSPSTRATACCPQQQDLGLVVGSGAWGPLGTFTSDTALVVTYFALFVAAAAAARRAQDACRGGRRLRRPDGPHPPQHLGARLRRPAAAQHRLLPRVRAERRRALARPPVRRAPRSRRAGRLPAARAVGAAPPPAPAEHPLPVRLLVQGRRRDLARRHRRLLRAADREPAALPAPRRR